jgi:enterochelin esterase family protein
MGTPLVDPLADPPRQVLVTFVYRSDKAQNVGVMTPRTHDLRDAQLTRIPGTDVWAKSFRVRDDAQFSYSFVVNVPAGAAWLKYDVLRQRTRVDPFNHRLVASLQTLVSLPNAPAYPLSVPARHAPTGEVHVHKVASKKPLTFHERRIYVYSPPGYADKGNAYPLVVLLGGSYYLSPIPTATILDNLIAQKRIPPTIAVAIDNVDAEFHIGTPERLVDVIADEIVPWVQKRYHATADPRAVVIGGLGLNGLAATLVAFRRPDVFGNVLSQAGWYWWSSNGDNEYESLTRQIAAAPKQPIRFYLEAGLLEGTGDPARPDTPSTLAANRHLRDVLIAKGYPVTFEGFAGDDRRGGTLGEALAKLLANARPGKAVPREVTSDLTVKDVGLNVIVPVIRAAALDGGEGALRVYRDVREKPDRYDIDEMALSAVGHDLLYLSAQPTAAIEVLEDNVRRFPNSSYAFLHLADAFVVTGDRARAIQNLKKAVELQPSNFHASSLLKALTEP